MQAMTTSHLREHTFFDDPQGYKLALENSMENKLMSGRIIVPFTEHRKSFEHPAPAWGRDKGSGEIFIRCGGCGKCIDLDHQVAANGDVTPSVWHDSPDCGWHVHITLEGWQP